MNGDGPAKVGTDRFKRFRYTYIAQRNKKQTKTPSSREYSGVARDTNPVSDVRVNDVSRDLWQLSALSMSRAVVPTTAPVLSRRQTFSRFDPSPPELKILTTTFFSTSSGYHLGHKKPRTISPLADFVWMSKAFFRRINQFVADFEENLLDINDDGNIGRQQEDPLSVRNARCRSEHVKSMKC